MLVIHSRASIQKYKRMFTMKVLKNINTRRGVGRFRPMQHPGPPGMLTRIAGGCRAMGHRPATPLSGPEGRQSIAPGVSRWLVTHTKS